MEHTIQSYINSIKELCPNLTNEALDYYADKPSKFYFQTIEPTTIINISYSHIQDCCDKFPEIERYIRLVVTQAHNALLGRMEGLLFDNAETRYLNFTADNPDLFNRVSVTDLCTYLGVERQTLTRIRKKLL